jgi:hypothetical protein
VGFAAVTRCVAYRRVFIVVRAKCDPRFSVINEMADSKEQYICVKIFFKLGKTALETHEMLKTASSDNAMGKHKFWSVSLDSNVGRTSRACS